LSGRHLSFNHDDLRPGGLEGKYAMGRPRTVFALSIVTAFLELVASEGPKADTARGKILSQQWCSQCHGVDVNQSSENPKAPSFSAIAIEPSATEYSLRTFLRIPHPTMPNFIIKPDDIDDIVGYIVSLKPQK
jgi:mono/diheme cytochrome c family protein